MDSISVNMSAAKTMTERNVEYVERKGIGHPDSLIDGIVESLGNRLSKEYLDKTGVILHHNVDKALIVGGASNVTFGRGEITKKVEVVLAGRATDEFKGLHFDVSNIAEDVVKDYLRQNTRFLDIEKETVIGTKIGRGSADLAHLFMRGKGTPLANDTSFGIGFAPFTTTESLVLETEAFLNSKQYKQRMPAVGEDIKVMGLREGGLIRLTIAVAFVAPLVGDLGAYKELKARVKSDVEQFAKKATGQDVRVDVNSSDNYELGEVYLTKSGLSCEAGDDGSVGRGNRVNGLITPFRHMSLEAASGKNPVSHVGKIYNIFATELAKDIVKQFPSVRECNVSVLSQIGMPIDRPQNLNVDISADEKEFESLKKKANNLAASWLENIGYLTSDIALGKFKTF